MRAASLPRSAGVGEPPDSLARPRGTHYVNPWRMASTSPISSVSHADQTTERYPSASAYFDTLPDGWASFPRCLARGSLVAGLRARGALDALDALPPPLRPLLEPSWAEAAWIPEVVHVATMLAVRDARFGNGSRADEQFLDWVAQLNRDLLGGSKHVESPIGVTPAVFVSRIPSLWEAYHAGTPMSVSKQNEAEVEVALAHPRHLFARLSLESHRRMLALSLAKANAVQPQVVLRTEPSGDGERTVFTAAWL